MNQMCRLNFNIRVIALLTGSKEGSLFLFYFQRKLIMKLIAMFLFDKGDCNSSFSISSDHKCTNAL